MVSPVQEGIGEDEGAPARRSSGFGDWPEEFAVLPDLFTTRSSAGGEGMGCLRVTPAWANTHP